MESTTNQASQQPGVNFTQKYAEILLKVTKAKNARRELFEQDLDTKLHDLVTAIPARVEAIAPSSRDFQKDKLDTLAQLLREQDELDREIEARLADWQNKMNRAREVVMKCLEETQRGLGDDGSSDT